MMPNRDCSRFDDNAPNGPLPGGLGGLVCFLFLPPELFFDPILHPHPILAKLTPLSLQLTPIIISPSLFRAPEKKVLIITGTKLNQAALRSSSFWVIPASRLSFDLENKPGYIFLDVPTPKPSSFEYWSTGTPVEGTVFQADSQGCRI